MGRFLIAVAAAITFAAPLAAQPTLCARPGMSERPDRSAAVTTAMLVGTYRCSEEGITVTLRLAADGRFEKRMDVEDAALRGEMGDDIDHFNRKGEWRIEGSKLHLFEQPIRPPEITLIKSRRDPAVWMRVEILGADGTPARELFVGDGPEANPRTSIDKGIVVVPRSSFWEPGLRHIVRNGDERRLTSFTATRDGPNSFRFVYRPSEVEPFSERAEIGEVRDGVMIPFGISGAVLRRVSGSAGRAEPPARAPSSPPGSPR